MNKRKLEKASLALVFMSKGRAEISALFAVHVALDVVPPTLFGEQNLKRRR